MSKTEGIQSGSQVAEGSTARHSEIAGIFLKYAVCAARLGLYTAGK